MKKYQLHLQLSPTHRAQPYHGWDALYDTRAEANAAAKRAERAGYHDVRIVSVKADAERA